MTKKELQEVLRALESGRTEIEAFEEDNSWYTPSGKLIDKIERAEAKVKEWIKNAK